MPPGIMMPGAQQPTLAVAQPLDGPPLVALLAAMVGGDPVEAVQKACRLLAEAAVAIGDVPGLVRAAQARREG